MADDEDLPTPPRCPNCDEAEMVEVFDEERGIPIWFCGWCHWEEDAFDWPENAP